MYWNPSDQSDAGNIIDFVQNRLQLNLDEVRKELRPWIDGAGYVPKSRGRGV